MDYDEFFAQRLAQLRVQAGVSARDMSLSIGQSAGYINKIENRQNLPSMSGFFYICEYLHITPQEFFSAEIDAPAALGALCRKMQSLGEKELSAVSALVDVICEARSEVACY